MASKRALSFIIQGGRSLSTSGEKAIDYCFVMGRHGKVAYPRTMYIGIDDYLKRQILTPIPSQFFHGKTQSPYELSDSVRKVLRSGGHSAFNLRKSETKFANPFKIGNVGILRSEGVIVFKTLEQFCGKGKRPEDVYQAYVDYLKELVQDYHGKVSLKSLPLDLTRYWTDIAVRGVRPHTVLYHATTMANDIYAAACIETYRILIHQSPTWYGKTKKTKPFGKTEKTKPFYREILEEIGKANKEAVVIILSHGLLVQFMPEYARELYKPMDFPFHLLYYALGAPSPVFLPKAAITPEDLPTHPHRIGSFLVHTMRHSAIHLVEHGVQEVVNKHFPNSGRLTRQKVLRAVRAQFPNYVADAAQAFATKGRWGLLRMNDLFPLLKIYTTAAQIGMTGGDKGKSLSDAETAEELKAEYTKKMDELNAEYTKKMDELNAEYTKKMDAYNNKQIHLEAPQRLVVLTSPSPR